MVNSYGERVAPPPAVLPPTWTLLQLAGVLAASLWFVRRASPRHRLAFVGALPFLAIGALAFDWLFEISAWALQGARGALPEPGGVVAYGALFGFVAVYVGLTMLRRRELAAALDEVIAPLLLVVAFGRVGCFFAGCEPGCATHAPWATVGALAQRVHPVALYEVVAALVALGVTRAAPRERFACGAVTYAALRFVIEFFRAHDGLVSSGQWTSLFVIGASLAWAARSPHAGHLVVEVPTDAPDDAP